MKPEKIHNEELTVGALIAKLQLENSFGSIKALSVSYLTNDPDDNDADSIMVMSAGSNDDVEIIGQSILVGLQAMDEENNKEETN